MRKALTVLAFAAAATFVPLTAAGAAVTAPAHHGGHGHGGGHHHGPNCNNDPNSDYAMNPDYCPPSSNADIHYGYDYDAPGEY